MPLNGTLKDHLVNKYDFNTFTGFYKFKKVKIDKKSVGFDDVGVIHRDYIVDGTVDITDLKTLLEIFKNDEFEWSTYYKIGNIIKNEDGDCKMFHDWAKYSTKYDKDKTQKDYDSYKKTKSGYNLGTLINLVTKKYPKIIKQTEDKYLDSITIPTIKFQDTGCDYLQYDEKYCKKLNNIIETHDTVVLKSHLGTGKTTVICDLNKEEILRVYSVLLHE
jgi:hypothetical protein